MPLPINTAIATETLERARECTDIVELIGQYVTLKKNGASFFGLCPFHSEDTPSFSVNPETHKYHCFGCSEHGDAIDFVMFMDGLTFVEAVNRLAGAIPASGKPQAIRPPQPPKTVWTAIIPVPPDAPDPPEKHFKCGAPSARWPYRVNGELWFYACRFDLPNGSKQVWPLSYCETSGGKKRTWRWKGVPAPRPLYNLDSLATMPDKNVLIVEGEKCADAGQAILTTMPVVSWCGGRDGVRHANWKPLKNRKVLLWPDNDNPGREAVREIAELLSGIASEIKFIAVPKDMPDKWDIADETWERADLLKFLKANVTDTPPEPAPDTDRATPESGPSQGIEPPAQPSPVPSAPDQPFRCLGFDHGEYYYLPHKTLQVLDLTAQAHTKNNLMTLAPLQWWEREYGGERGVAWDQAVNALIRTCENSGIFSPLKIRGRGAWFDDGRIIMHAGDHLLINGVRTDISAINSEFVYEAGRPIDFGIAGALPLSTPEAHKLIMIAEQLPWEKSIYALLFSGWVALAPICGALTWRPHIWVTGRQGTGKSWTFDNVVRPILGKASLYVQSGTTEAFIRQLLKNDAFAVLYDEAESKQKDSQHRIASILELIRQSSTDTGGIIGKGSISNSPKIFNIRSMFYLGSITIGIEHAADQARITILNLRPRDPWDNPRAKFEALQSAVASIIAPSWCSAFRARSVNMIPIIRKNAEIFSKVIAEKLSNQRAGDQMGTLIAGAYSLHSEKIISPEIASEWVEKHDWTEHAAQEIESDEMRCLNRILQHILTVTDDGRRYDRSVAELISLAANLRLMTPDDVSPVSENTAKNTLLRTGIKVTETEIFISNSHTEMAKIMEKSAWERNWNMILRRIEGAKDVLPTRFNAGIKTRAVSIPIEIMGNE